MAWSDVMSIETEAVLDRRALRRRLTAWRSAFIVAGVLAAGAIAFALGAGESISQQRQIARVTIEGTISEDRQQLRMLERLAKAPNVAAVVVSINSGGGTTTGGEALFEAIRDLAKQKPVVAQFGTVAASAAYICGLAADHIVARGNSITGSVGVIFQWPEVSGLLDKVGVKMNEIKSGPLKATPSMFEPISPGGRQVAEQMVAESQSWFLGLVKARRSIDTASVPGLEQGRVFSGREAVKFKLVDEIGGEAEAIKWLETKRGVPAKLRVVDWRPARADAVGLFRWIGMALADMWGGAAGENAMLSQIESLRSRLALDGLVSVWQPHEK
jgi:protease IV